MKEKYKLKNVNSALQFLNIDYSDNKLVTEKKQEIAEIMTYFAFDLFQQNYVIRGFITGKEKEFLYISGKKDIDEETKQIIKALEDKNYELFEQIQKLKK
ncbi:MAG: hypothetical protein GY849_02450 [Deltaproteobacteria bacterium]|nr:hypothetical protein [Deltaproteobacteria bacterium]